LKLKKIDIVFIIIFAILTIISIDLLLVKEHQAAITNLWDTTPFQDISSGLAITFVICVIGNLLPVPTPYSFVVCGGFALIATNPFIPLLFAFIASLGCLVGEMGGWFVGRGAAEVISEERAEKLKKYQDFVVRHPKLMPFLIFLAALTPINDDNITVPAGLIKISFRTTVFWCWLGKLGMMILMAYNAFGLLNFIQGGLCGLFGGENWITSIIFLYVTVIIIYLLLRAT
jgi:membrane protein YqaA with SNARE-associated domain